LKRCKRGCSPQKRPVATEQEGGVEQLLHLINPETGNRIQMITQDAETEQPVSRRNLVKGYEFKKNTYLLLTDEDFESVKVESSEMMTVEKFVEADSIDSIYYDTSYYTPLMPEPENPWAR